MVSIRNLMPEASQRLITVPDTAPVTEAAKILTRGRATLVIVCNAAGKMVGVVSNADVVRQLSHCAGCSCTETVSQVMTREVISCHPDDELMTVWSTMKRNDLKQMPIANTAAMPLALLYANDVLQVLLNEVEYTEELLREYVMGIGYH
ncbi:CBS domain-containing protein [Alcaligenaceae bacterium]|nr:CBS domain-containing protein [Alcaligenaceae bacterium]